MSWVEAQSDVVCKVTCNLSNLKVKTLLLGGRLTLLKSILGAIPTYSMYLFKAPEGVLKSFESMRNCFFLGADLEKKMTWVNWKKVIAQKVHGGLGASNLFALNRALIFKWVWIFLPSPTTLWIKIVRAIHGVHGLIGSITHKNPRY